MTFGQRLRKLRENKDIKQTELSKQLGMTSQALSQYELDKRMPDANILKSIADYFDVTVDYLLGRTDIKKINNKEKDSSKIETKAYHNLDVGGLSEEAIKQVEDYIELIKLKYNPDGTLKKKD